ncbi:MAG: hypothetical protein LBT17_02755 [Mycoplasmataceae bacterium]|nr:hypothetical protein [Mycoplasmataceae bacterium]
MKNNKTKTPNTWEEWGEWFDRKSVENIGCPPEIGREIRKKILERQKNNFI